jgi:hypothetical protein
VGALIFFLLPPHPNQLWGSIQPFKKIGSFAGIFLKKVPEHRE